MFLTSPDYIHEYDSYDSLAEFIKESIDDMDLATARYKVLKHDLEMKIFFEESSVDECESIMEAENEGLVTKLGNFIIGLMKKLQDLITKVTGVFTNRGNSMQQDAEKLTQMIKEHPELANDIINGINKEWFTVKDVVKFQKDALGLINMLQANRISHETFRDKLKNLISKFNDDVSPFVTGIQNVKTILGFPRDFVKICKDSRDGIVGFRKMCGEIKNHTERNYAVHDANTASAVMNALGQVSGIVSGECKDRQEKMGKFASFLNKMANSKLGQKIHADDASREKRHMAAFNKLANKESGTFSQHKQDRLDELIKSTLEDMAKKAPKRPIDPRFPVDRSAFMGSAAQKFAQDDQRNKAMTSLLSDAFVYLRNLPELSQISDKDLKRNIGIYAKNYFKNDKGQNKGNSKGKNP